MTSSGPTGIDLAASDTGGAIGQIIAARQPGRLATLTLTICETHDNVPPRAFNPAVLLARTGPLGLLGPLMLNYVARARSTVFGNCYQSPELPGDQVVRAYPEPVIGGRKAARQFQRWIPSLRARDLLAVEPDLKRLTAPTLIVWAAEMCSSRSGGPTGFAAPFPASQAS